jgi:hypothetical protein
MMKKTIISVIVLLASIFLGWLVVVMIIGSIATVANTIPTKGNDKQVKVSALDERFAEFKSGYMEGCMEGADAIKDANGYCTCTLEELELRNGKQGSIDIAEEYGKTEVLPDEFASIIDYCVEKLY